MDVVASMPLISKSHNFSEDLTTVEKSSLKNDAIFFSPIQKFPGVL